MIKRRTSRLAENQVQGGSPGCYQAENKVGNKEEDDRQGKFAEADSSISKKRAGWGILAGSLLSRRERTGAEKKAQLIRPMHIRQGEGR